MEPTVLAVVVLMFLLALVLAHAASGASRWKARAEEAEATSHQRATVEFEQWRGQELEAVRQEMRDTEHRAALVEMEEWKQAMHERAAAEFERWRGTELQTARQEMKDAEHRSAIVEIEEGMRREEKKIREDAIQRSQAVTVGKVFEHLIPYLPQFSYNPKDARFLGSPIDYVVFDGLNDGCLKRIVFLEVKTGASQLSTRERLIRDCVAEGRVLFQALSIPRADAKSDDSRAEVSSSAEPWEDQDQPYFPRD